MAREIFQYVDATTLVNVGLACKQLSRSCLEPGLWQPLILDMFFNVYNDR